MEIAPTPGATGFRTRPPNEFSSTVETLSAIAIMAQDGWTRPVVASGTPIPLKKKARH